MKINWWAISSIFICFVLLGLLIKSCQDAKNTKTSFEDSLLKRQAVSDSIKKEGDKAKDLYDSVFHKSLADSATHKKTNDSLSTIIAVLKNKYSVAKDSTITLWKQLKIFYDRGDTADLRIAYYGLRDQLDSANHLVVDIQFRDQALEYNLRNNLDSTYGVIRTLHGQLDTLKLLLDTQTKNVEAATADQQKLLIQQKKKRIWDLIEKIGIGIGGIFVGSKL